MLKNIKRTYQLGYLQESLREIEAYHIENLSDVNGWELLGTIKKKCKNMSQVDTHYDAFYDKFPNSLKVKQICLVEAMQSHRYTVAESILGAIRTCLLYTSPSPRDQRGSRMPSSA